MKAKVVICKNHQEASEYAAALLRKAFLDKPDMTLTFAAGDTPLACYQELIQQQNQGQVDLKKAHYIGLDEWVGLGMETQGSCIATITKGYYEPAHISQKQIDAFDGLTQDVDAEIQRMRDLLQSHPLELAVVGVGVNGHIAFNEPGAVTTGDFSLVPLDETTQQVGKKYFGGNSTPTQGVTITLEALKKAKQILIIATGVKKKAVVGSILQEQTDLPVSAFLDHPGAYYIFDEEAAGARE